VVKIAGAPSTLNAYEKLFGVSNLASAVGATVLEIDDEPAVEHLLHFANHSIGSSKDINIRYNLANTRFIAMNNNGYYPGAFQQRSVMNPWPDTQAQVKYRVRLTSGQETTYTLPWAADVSHTYTGEDQFAATCMAAPASDNVDAKQVQRSLTESVAQQIRLPEMRRMAPIPLPRSLSSAIPTSVSHPPAESLADSVSQKLRDPIPLRQVHPTLADSSNITTLLASPGISFYQVSDNVGVVVIPSFEPQGGMFQFSANLEKGFRMLKEKNLGQIILDLSHNGGGM
jgi:hypothetical protein